MEGDSTEQSANSSGFQIHSPDLFSDDEEESNEVLHAQSPVQCEPCKETKQSHQEEMVVKLESARLQRLLELLQGVPPPPSKTIPQISVVDVLRSWKDQTEKDILGRNEKCSMQSLWKPTVSLDEVVSSEWPDMKHAVFHDLHYNVCTASEDVERLSMKLHERYVGAETSTWCNPAISSLSNSAKKRQRTRGLGHTSPGCRLSHLARRRQTFSSANLAQLSSVAGSGTAGGAPPRSLKGPSAARRLLMSGPGGANERRRIMVEIKKTDKNKRIKTNSKIAQSKAGSSSSAGGTMKSSTQEKPPVQSTKRALFQSPEEEKRAALVPVVPVSLEQNPALRSKRALWPADSHGAINEYGKRSLDVDSTHSLQQSKVQCIDEHSRHIRTSRSLPFFVGQSNSNNKLSSAGCSEMKATRRASDQGPSSHANSLSSLSELHKRKLYWAISQTLRKEGISTKNSDFRPCATMLAHHYINVRSDMTEAPTSTSEHMLQVVSLKVKEVVQAHRTSKSGQEENHCNDRLPKKEERSNKELFRDATASLNVRRSLSASLSSSDQLSSDMKSHLTRRVPSARKSLTFDCIDLKDDGTHDSISLSEKGNDGKRKSIVENVLLSSVKRVSRSLFLSPTDDSKAIMNKKDSKEVPPEDLKHKLLSTVDASNPGIDVSVSKDEHSSEFDSGKVLNINPAAHQGSDSSSVPSSLFVPISTDNETDNETSRVCETSIKAGQVIQSACSNSLTINHFSNNLSSSSGLSNGSIRKNVQDPTDGEFFLSQSRILRDTKQRAARVFQAQPTRRVTRMSHTQFKRDLRSSSTESGDLRSSSMESGDFIGNSENQLAKKPATCDDVPEVQIFPSATNSIENVQDQNSVHPLKGESEVGTEGALTAPKSEFGSPLFLEDTVVTETSESNSALKAQTCHNGGGSLSSDVSAAPDLNSEVSEINKDSDTVLEAVITPLLEAAAHESSVCIGSEPLNSVDTNLTFRGRIESLKPLASEETSVGLDSGLSYNVSSNILGVDEVHEKSPVLEKWAERASRSSQKVSVSDENTIEHSTNQVPSNPKRQCTETMEDSLLVWEESQLDATSQCSTKLFEEFKSIFDSSSQQGNS